MPYFDKPEWIQHGGAIILSVDFDCTGQRMATSGLDSKVRIWSMRPLISEAAELDSSVPKQLAVLADAKAPTNCVRFSPKGCLLAVGRDDNDVLVYELSEGRASGMLGEAANVENWVLRQQLRGHNLNVLDLAWAPDGRRLATASIDNRVKLWDVPSGHCIRTLEGHVGHVKGVAWDPFDFFLASQSDYEAIVWRLEDGALVTRVTEPFVGAPNVGFALRPSWSPDGQTLALANGYERGVHTVPILQRNTWLANDMKFAGHNMSVTVVRHNPHLYFGRKAPEAAAPGAAGASAASGSGGGGGRGGEEEEENAAGCVVAVGSFDKSFSLWHPTSATPLLVGTKFFNRMVNDLAWSIDGRMMALAGYDGTLVTVTFNEGELGRRVPEQEVRALQAQLYGDPRVRSQKSALTAAPELLQLEARAQADVQREERLSNRMGSGPPGVGLATQGTALTTPAATTVAAGETPAGALQIGPAPPPSGTVAAAAGAGAPSAANGVMSLPPAATLRTAAAASGLAAGIRSSSPAKAPAVGGAGRLTSSGAAGPSGRDADQPAAKRTAFVGPAAGPPPAPSWMASAGGGAARGRPGISEGGFGGTAAAVPQAAVAATNQVVVPYDPIRPFLSLLMHVPASPGELQACMELQALNRDQDARGRPIAELMCLVGPSQRWCDSVQGNVVCMAGSSKLAAVSTTNGDLMVYSSAGRRLFPPICLGCPASYMSVAKGGTVLLAVLSNGQARMWDFATAESLLETSVVPLLGPATRGPGQQVAAVRITASGCPVVVLGNAHAFAHHSGLRCWVRVADDAFPASTYTSGIASAATGELSKLQAGAAQRRNPRDVLAATAAQTANPATAARSDRALLEHNLAAAAVVQSPNEWRLWLIAYVRRLARDADESRLRDIISELMGPLRWTPSTHPGAAAGPGQGAGGGGSEPPLGSSVTGRWQPSFLGFDKRLLLREVVLKEANKNRELQQLVAEVLEQLKQIEAAVRGPPARTAGVGAGGSEAAGPPGVGGEPQLQAQPMVLG